jgi:hypothetical protein
MTAAIVFVIALMLLATQLMVLGSTGAWPNITLASEFSIAPDRVFSDWIILEKPIHFLLYDTQLWIILVFTAALVHWLTDWTSETLGIAAKFAPPPDPKQEPRPEAQGEQPELADSGKSL